MIICPVCAEIGQQLLHPGTLCIQQRPSSFQFHPAAPPFTPAVVLAE
jgi:hypothetical protein